MPTVLRVKGHEFFFRAGDCPERPHVHIRGSVGAAKVWLHPIELAYSTYNAAKTAAVLSIAQEHQPLLIEQWGRFCGG